MMVKKLTLLDKVKKNWVKFYFLISIVMLAFFYGFFAGENRYFPFHPIHSGLVAAKDWIQNSNFNHYLGLRPEKFIHPARHEGSGVTVYAPDKIQDGITLITSMWDHTNGIKLIDRDGSVIHEWRISLKDIWPEAPHVRKPFGNWNFQIHGVKLYPNGDVLFNYKGLVKMDKCSNVIWKLFRETHHSIYEDKDKNLWVADKTTLTAPVKRLPLLKPPVLEQHLLKFSPEGKILREISILEVFLNSGKYTILSANGMLYTRLTGNFTHINDVEILEESMADQFPLFNTDDIMVSMRNLNLIVVIDSVTEKIKWSMMGPFHRQHDPDFLPNGRISVFDNQSDNAGGRELGGSRILSIDPVTKKVETIYTGNSQDPFYTEVSGKHQYLQNGNFLITEANAGRVFEVTSSGEIVWSYINRYDEDEVYTVLEGTRLSGSMRNFADKGHKCPQ